MSYWNRLPPEIKEKIFDDLDYPDLLKVVSKKQAEDIITQRIVKFFHSRGFKVGIKSRYTTSRGDDPMTVVEIWMAFSNNNPQTIYQLEYLYMHQDMFYALRRAFPPVRRGEVVMPYTNFFTYRTRTRENTRYGYYDWQGTDDILIEPEDGWTIIKSLTHIKFYKVNLTYIND
jgi:hypothetical protein